MPTPYSAYIFLLTLSNRSSSIAVAFLFLVTNLLNTLPGLHSMRMTPRSTSRFGTEMWLTLFWEWAGKRRKRNIDGYFGLIAYYPLIAKAAYSDHQGYGTYLLGNRKEHDNRTGYWHIIG